MSDKEKMLFLEKCKTNDFIKKLKARVDREDIIAWANRKDYLEQVNLKKKGD